MPSAKLFCACVIRLDTPAPGVPLAQTGKPRFRGVFNPFYLLCAQSIAHTTNTLISSIIRESQTQIDLDGLGLLHEGQRSHLWGRGSGGRACLRQQLSFLYILREGRNLSLWRILRQHYAQRSMPMRSEHD